MDTTDKFRTYDEVRTFSPALACEIGIKEAIFVRQLEYWLGNDKSGKTFNGKRWIRDTISEWHKQLQFWSRRTVNRVVNKLMSKEILIKRNDLNRHGYDRTNWYTLDFDKLNDMFENSSFTINLSSNPSNDKIVPNSHNGERQNGTKDYDTMAHTIPKHSSKISSKNMSSSKEQDQLTREAKGVIKLLNEKSGKHFKCTKGNLGMIRARIRSGYSNKDFAYVIMYKVDTWNNPKMKQYIRPKTLFTEQHMDDYLDEAISSQSDQGRQSSENSSYKTDDELKKEDEEQRKELQKKIKEMEES